MNSGIYIRLGQKDVLLEDMNIIERQKWLQDLQKDSLMRTVNILCDALSVSNVQLYGVATKED